MENYTYIDIQKKLQIGDICNLEFTNEVLGKANTFDESDNKYNIEFRGYTPCNYQGKHGCEECKGYAIFGDLFSGCYNYDNKDVARCPIVILQHSIELEDELFEI